MLRIEFSSADPTNYISELGKHEITLHDIRFKNDLTFCAHIEHKEYFRVAKIAKHKNCNIKVLDRNDLLYHLRKTARRPVLILGVLIVLLLTIYLPTRILFLEIKGNERINSIEIKNCLEENGVYFGVSRRSIRSEAIKNAVLSELPELQWVGVNTYGCVAVISVKESGDLLEKGQESGISSVISSADAVIAGITVKRGTALCSVGQAVKKGQKLISGYTDCGIALRGERATGEIYGYTRREIIALTLQPDHMVANGDARRVRFSIKLGKNIINLRKDSSNLGMGCGKIYSEIYISLPGGFDLPIAIVKETYIPYVADIRKNQSQQCDWLLVSVENYLHRQMRQGEILAKEYSFIDTTTYEGMTCRYFCKEMIGYELIEELIQ